MSGDRRLPGGRRRLTLFVLVGGVAALANVLSRMALNLAMSYEAAIVLAYVCGMTVAYLLNKAFVFAPSGRSVADEYLRFTVVNLLAVAQVWVVSVGLARFAFPWLDFGWHAETVAHVVGVIVPVFTSFYGHEHFSFSVARRYSALKGTGEK